ncbi:MAG: N-acetylmuramoyl-L-alanine amidase [Ruminococcaceae bacterium]|nr:N-acetylmuramoyl-L-alanine amidase [Oscillospiraceae bacterium]
MAIRIFIDQGHNPQNPNAGAEGNGLREQDVTYAVGVELARLLNENGNYETELSRNSPSEILGTSNADSLARRVRAANAFGADYFISIHTNASEFPSAMGSEAFVYNSNSPAIPLAESILDGLEYATGFPPRGVYSRPTLYVLRRTQMPALLLEIGFITNPAEAYLMETDPGLFAAGIYNGILNYFGN